MKKALLIRYGAFGDVIMLTPLLRALKEDNYHVTLNMTPRARPVLNNNPFIDRFIIQKDDEIPNEELDEYWKKLGKGYDKVINLSGSVEDGLLKVEGKKEFNWSKERRHAECNVNYYDKTLEIGGYGHIKGKNGELYFSRFEEKLAKDYRRKYKGKFLILWSLSGSSFHKAYPYAEYVAKEVLKKYDDTMILTVGDNLCEVLEWWGSPRTKCYSGKWSIRKSMIMTKYVNLVVGTETGILNAAGCFDTPKIVLLSHSTNENLSKYWKNCIPLHADTDCYPCHQLHYSLDSCPVNEKIRSPKCMADLKARKVFDAIEGIYLKWWKEKNYGTLPGNGRKAVLRR